MKKLSILKSKNKTHPQNPVETGVEDDVFVKGLTNLYSPEEGQQDQRRDIADELLESGKINNEQFENIRRIQREKPGIDIASIVKQQRIVDAEQLLEARAKLFGYEFRELIPEEVDRGAYSKLECEYIKNNRVLPFSFKDEGQTLLVATSEPGNVFAIDEVKRITSLNAEIVVCKDENIDSICEVLEASSFEYDVDDIISDMDEVELLQDEETDSDDLEQMAAESPVIKFVNYLISNALHEGASDIHLEPKEKHSRIRYRIDGVLFEAQKAPAKMHAAVVSRLKIMSNLDISERRLPQDGKIAVKVAGRAVDLRVSTLPVTQGEKVVIRILDKKSIMYGLDQSGMQPDVRSQFEQQITLPHGIILVTGPTGSGKSTTLYSALGQMDGNKLNISTVEDPVEYELGFCNQVQTKESIGMTFGSALRSLLRQDPDIIMIGEIRDAETARIAVQAALTGHLVLSTLHTNDAPSSITRLVNIGVDPYLIAASLNAVLAQRLVRKICQNCKEHYGLPDNIKKSLEGVDIDYGQLVQGKGCDKCRNSGYSGRTGVYEFLVVNDQFRKIINQDASVNNMRAAFERTGALSLFNDGIIKVKQGITTVEEVLRVTQAADLGIGDDVIENADISQEQCYNDNGEHGEHQEHQEHHEHCEENNCG